MGFDCVMCVCVFVAVCLCNMSVCLYGFPYLYVLQHSNCTKHIILELAEEILFLSAGKSWHFFGYKSTRNIVQVT